MMSGIPAGYEDDFSDDDYNFTEQDYQDFLVNGDDSYLNKHKEEEKLPRSGNIKATESVFNQYRTVSKNLKNELSLDSENIRIAIVEEKNEYLENALKSGFKVDTVLKSGWSALMYAASNGSLNIIKLLLENGASVNFKAGSLTPVMVVSQSAKKGEENLIQCSELLIKYGANINEHDKHIMTPLMYASQLGHSKFVNLLCRHGALVNIQESRGWTALCFAAANGFSHVVKVLLENGADHNITTIQGEKAVDLAFSNGFTMLSDLLEKYDGSSTESLGNVPEQCSRLVTTDTTKYVNYGDLELFLFGLELGHLVPVMQDQHLTFTQILKLEEGELLEVGVEKLGDRKTLYNALQNVRSNEWDTSNLTKKDLTKLGTLDVAAVIANAAKHLDCIQSCIAYSRKVIQKNKEEIKEDNTNLQRTLIEQCRHASKLSKEIDGEITALNNDVVSFFPDVHKIEADFIGKQTSIVPNDTRSKKKMVFFVSCVGIVTFGGFSAYKWLQKPT